MANPNLANMGFIETIQTELVPRFLSILKAPLTSADMLWIAIPLIIALLLVEFYFKYHNKELLRWDPLTGNALILIFVSLDLFREINNTVGFQIDLAFLESAGIQIKAVLAGLIGIVGLLGVFTKLLHILPKRTPFKFSGILIINLFAYISVSLVYTHVPMDPATIISIILLLILLMIIFSIAHLFQNKAKEYFDFANTKNGEFNNPDHLATKEIRENPFSRNFEDHGDYPYRKRPTRRSYKEV